MPKAIHDRAMRLLPEMKKTYPPKKAKQVAFAVSTQQAHATGEAPKRWHGKPFGTPEGKREAKAKFDEPKSEYKSLKESAAKDQQQKAKFESWAKAFQTRVKQASAPSSSAARLRAILGPQVEEPMPKTKQADIADIIREHPYLASSVIGAGVGGLGGAALHSLTKEKDRKKQLRRILEGAALGGMAAPAITGTAGGLVGLGQRALGKTSAQIRTKSAAELTVAGREHTKPQSFALLKKEKVGEVQMNDHRSMMEEILGLSKTAQDVTKMTGGEPGKTPSPEGGAKGIAFPGEMSTAPGMGQSLSAAPAASGGLPPGVEPNFMTMTPGGPGRGQMAPMGPLGGAGIQAPSSPLSPPGGGMMPTSGVSNFMSLLEEVQERAFQESKAKYAQDYGYQTEPPTVREAMKEVWERPTPPLPVAGGLLAGAYGAHRAEKGLRARGAELGLERGEALRKAMRRGKPKEIAAARGALEKTPRWATKTLLSRSLYKPRMLTRLGLGIGGPLAGLFAARAAFGQKQPAMG